jgi:alkylhydroperoxidase/carboxymuconolactone decarboxylase family protein YurZ
MTDKNLMSNAFQTFITEAPEHQKAWMEAIQKLGLASKLDPKVEELAYIAVLSSARMESGLPFHVKHENFLKTYLIMEKMGHFKVLYLY